MRIYHFKKHLIKEFTNLKILLVPRLTNSALISSISSLPGSSKSSIFEGSPLWNSHPPDWRPEKWSTRRASSLVVAFEFFPGLYMFKEPMRMRWFCQSYLFVANVTLKLMIFREFDFCNHNRHWLSCRKSFWHWHVEAAEWASSIVFYYQKSQNPSKTYHDECAHVCELNNICFLKW